MKWWGSQSRRSQAFIVLGAIVVLGVISSGGAANRSTPSRDEGLAAATSQGTFTAATATPAKTAAPTAAPTAASKQWHVVGQWQGTGNKNTEDFTVTSDQWRVDYDYAGGGLIQIYVYRSSDKHLVDLVGNTQSAGADSSFEHSAGTYYLQVNSFGNGWKLDVQDQR